MRTPYPHSLLTCIFGSCFVLREVAAASAEHRYTPQQKCYPLPVEKYSIQKVIGYTEKVGTSRIKCPYSPRESMQQLSSSEKWATSDRHRIEIKLRKFFDFVDKIWDIRRRFKVLLDEKSTFHSSLACSYTALSSVDVQQASLSAAFF